MFDLKSPYLLRKIITIYIKNVTLHNILNDNVALHNI